MDEENVMLMTDNVTGEQYLLNTVTGYKKYLD